MPTGGFAFDQAQNYPKYINMYVPAMTCDANLDHSLEKLISFGTPYLADTDALLAAAAVGATYYPSTMRSGVSGFTQATGEVDGTFGRDITLVGSGAGTNSVTVTGYDYLGQKIVKVKALTGATPVLVGVAFKRIESIVIASGGSITVDVGFGINLGLPYKTSAVIEEYADGVKTASLGTLTAPVTTDPATNATGDPRGLYSANTTLDGAKELVAKISANNYVNSSGNGGLHGIQHYGG